MYWYVLVCTGIYWFVLVCTGTYQHVLHIFPTHISCWIQTGTYQDVHSGTLSYCLVSSCPLLDTRRYKAVQGSENWYNEVQGSTRKSCTPGYGGTRKYMKVQGLVPPCTSISRGTGLSGTALYRLVPPRIQKRTGRYERNQNLRNMLVCTSTYLYILVHTDSYQLCKSRPIHTLVLVCTSTYQYR